MESERKGATLPKGAEGNGALANAVGNHPWRMPSQDRRDWIALSALLILLCLLFIPVIAMSECRAWCPPCPESLWKTIRMAFAETGPQGYNPTTAISLACDYFSCGRDWPAAYPLHSLFGLLCKTAFMWLFLRRLRVWRSVVFCFALFAAILPDGIDIVMEPLLRGRIALSLFSYAALWFTCHLDSRRWLWWSLGAAMSCFVALGASMWAGVLIPAMPILAWSLKGEKCRMITLAKRLAIPEIVSLATFFFVVYMT